MSGPVLYAVNSRVRKYVQGRCQKSFVGFYTIKGPKGHVESYDSLIICFGHQKFLDVRWVKGDLFILCVEVKIRGYVSRVADTVSLQTPTKRQEFEYSQRRQDEPK